MQQNEINVNNYQNTFWLKAIELIIIVMVTLVPIVFYPRCITVFSPAKELLAEILIILGLMFWALRIIDSKKIIFDSASLNLPIVIFMAIFILSLIWSNNFIVSLKELPLFLAGPLLYFIVTNNINHERQINRILNALIIVGSLFGVYGILQYNGIDLPIWIRNVGRNQVFGLFGNVNFFAEYLIIPLPIAVSLFFVSRNKFKKCLLFIGILAMGTALMFTFTRGSYLAFGSALIVMFFLFLTSRDINFIKNNKKIFIIIIAAVIIITSLFFIPTPLSKSGTVISKIKSRISPTQLTQDIAIRRRMATWNFTALMIKDRPLLGSGIGTFKYNTLKYQAKFFGQGQNRSLYIHGFAVKAHNEYLQLWAELGIIGLGIFIWLIIGYFSYGLRFLKKSKNNYYQGIVIGFMGVAAGVLVDGIFGFPLHLIATVILFWLCIGLTMVVTKSEFNTDKDEFNQKYNEKENKKEKNKKQVNLKEKGKEYRNNKKNILGFKLFLSIGIILLAVFLCTLVIRPFIARVYWFYGDRELRNKDFNKAIKTYEQALRWDPYLGDAYYQIGQILEGKRIYNISMEFLEKAEKYVALPTLPQHLASVYLRNNLLDKAAIKLKQAISYMKEEKSMFPMYHQLGTVYYRLKKYREAEIAFKDALKIFPNYVIAHYELAETYLQQDKQDEALEEFKIVIELAPESSQAKLAREKIQKIEQQ